MLSRTGNADSYVETNELLLPLQCGESIGMDVYFKPISNEGLDGDRTITLSHKVATGVGI